MLKDTSVNFELLTDIDMDIFIKRDIRGGLRQIHTGQQVHAIVRPIKIIIVFYVFEYKQLIRLGNLSTIARFSMNRRYI